MPQDLNVLMSLEQNEVSLHWTRPAVPNSFTLSYKAFYTVNGVCAVSNCQAAMCRVPKRIRNKAGSVTFNQPLFAFSNYTWRLEVTYTNDGSVIERYNVSIDVQTSQSSELSINITIYTTACKQLLHSVTFTGASAPVNLTVLSEGFDWMNLTWGIPRCPNGMISHYRVCTVFINILRVPLHKIIYLYIIVNNYYTEVFTIYIYNINRCTTMIIL